MNAAIRQLGARNIWLIANLSLLAVCFILLILFFTGGGERSREASESGRQILIDLTDGSIYGYLRRIEPEASTATKIAERKMPPRRDHDIAEETPETLPDRAAPVEEPPSSETTAEESTHPIAGDFSEKEPTETVINPTAEMETDHETAETPSTGHDAEASEESHEAAQHVTETEPHEAEHVSEEPAAEEETDEEYATDTEQEITAGKMDIPASAGRPLRHAPQPELSEKTADGILPKIGEDGSTPWKAYSKLDRYQAPMNKPLVSIIVTGLGLGRYTTEAAYELPENFTLSFSPYARKVDVWAGHARNIGHEVLLDLPMQTVDFPATDPGPYALLNIKQIDENRERLRWLMMRFPGAMGFIAPYDAQAPDSVMLSAMVDIGTRGLLFVDMEGAAAERMDSKKKDMGLIDITATQVVDLSLNEFSIAEQLAALEKTAHEKGYAIGIARPYPVTLKQLQSWYQSLEKKGIELAPLSAIADKIN